MRLRIPLLKESAIPNSGNTVWNNQAGERVHLESTKRNNRNGARDFYAGNISTGKCILLDSCNAVSCCTGRRYRNIYV